LGTIIFISNEQICHFPINFIRYGYVVNITLSVRYFHLIFSSAISLRKYS